MGPTVAPAAHERDLGDGCQRAPRRDVHGRIGAEPPALVTSERVSSIGDQALNVSHQ